MTADVAELEKMIRREQGLSALINTLLSVFFFLVTFDLGRQALTFAAPDNFARDFLPQGFMVALMGSAVPALILRRRLGKALNSRRRLPSIVAIMKTVALSLVAGLVSAGLLMTIVLLVPFSSISIAAGIAAKAIYGAVLGALCTGAALNRLYLPVYQPSAGHQD